MGRGQRLALIAAAVAVAAGTFVVLSPGDDDDDGSPSGTSAQTTTTPTGTTEQPPPPPEPVTAKLVVTHDGVQGGMETIKANKGDEVQIDVESEIEDELHLHGYDIKKDVPAGGTAKFRLTADLEGVFELEAHHLGDVVIAELVVEP